MPTRRTDNDKTGRVPRVSASRTAVSRSGSGARAATPRAKAGAKTGAKAGASPSSSASPSAASGRARQIQGTQRRAPSQTGSFRTPSRASSQPARTQSASRAYRGGAGMRAGNVRTAGTRAQRAAGAPGGRPGASGRAGSGLAAFAHAHPRIAFPLAAILIVFILAVVVDLAVSMGKVHPGVKVQGVDVGGLTHEEAAQRIEEQLKPRLNDATISLYKDEATAQNDGAQLASAGSADPHAAAADEDDTDAAAGTDGQATTGVDSDGDGTDDRWNVTASTVGAAIDSEKLADEAFAQGRSWAFFSERIDALLGKTDIPASITCNSDLLSDLSAEINEAIGTPIVDYTVAIDDGEASISEGHDGRSVDEGALTENMCTAFFDSSAPATTIPLQTSSVHIARDTAERVLSQIQHALSQPFTVSYNDKSWTLDAAAIGALVGQQVLAPGEVLVFEENTQKVKQAADGAQAGYDTSAGTDASGYVLQAFIDQDKADAHIVELLGDEAEGDVQNASFDTSSGTPQIVESHVGTGPDHHGAARAMQDDLFGDAGEHSVKIEEVVIQPEISTEDAQKMGIAERLSSWSIPMSGTTARMGNIDLLCKLIDGSLVKPGGTWSFNATTGERTEAKGFQKAPVIVNGAHEDQLGGGVCQVATCVYNAACYAGLGIENRVNHSFYISTYDDTGFADATVSWPEPDFAFVNDMDNWVLLTASADEDAVTVSLWGTKDGRVVTCERGEWQEGEKYQQIRQEDPTLAAGVTELTQSGVDGRKIKIHYLVKSASGETLHDIEFNSEYVPQNEITKVGTSTDANAAKSVSEAKSRSS